MDKTHIADPLTIGEDSILEGRITKQFFVTKGGKQTGKEEFYFKTTTDQSYFVLLKKHQGSLHKESLEKYVDQPVIINATVIDYYQWDASSTKEDFPIQSRVGPAIVIRTAQSKEVKKISITGIAKNTKAGAIVLTDEGSIFYIDAMREWDQLLNQKVQVSGNLVIVTHGAPYRSGAIADGLEGDQAIIKNAEVKLYK